MILRYHFNKGILYKMYQIITFNKYINFVSNRNHNMSLLMIARICKLYEFHISF